MKRLETLRPGQMPTPKQYNELAQRVNSLSNITGRNGVTVRPTNNGVSITGQGIGLVTQSAHIYKDGGVIQTITADSATVVNLKETFFDNADMVDSATNQINIPDDGIYHITSRAEIRVKEDLPTGGRHLLFINGLPLPTLFLLSGDLVENPDSGSSVVLQCDTIASMSKGDKVSLIVDNTSSPSPSNDYILTGGFGATYLAVARS